LKPELGAAAKWETVSPPARGRGLKLIRVIL